MANATTTATQSATPSTSAPTVASPVEIDWGDWAAQILNNSKAVIETAAEGGATLLLGQIPFGSILTMFIGPTVIKQYVDQGVALLSGMVEGQELTASGALETYVFAALNKYEPLLVQELGDQITPLIKAALAKVGITS